MRLRPLALHWLPLLLVAAGLVGALTGLVRRAAVESSPGARRVLLTLDYAQVRTLALAAAPAEEDLLRRFRAAGIGALAIPEETLAELETEGLLRVAARADGQGTEYRVEVASPAVAQRVADAAQALLRSTSEERPAGDTVSLPGYGGGRLFLPGRWNEVRSLSAGLDPVAIQRAREAGLEPVPRLQNSLGMTEEGLEWSLRQARAAGGRLVICAGEEVLGYRGLLREAAERMRGEGLLYGSVEFGRQRGDEALARLMEDRLVRVHSISAAEMPRLTPGEAIERYVRAAVERNIRVLYVRLPVSPEKDTLAESLAYTRRLARAVTAAGFGLASPAPLGRVWSTAAQWQAAAAVMALGVGGGATLLLACLLPIRPAQQARWALLLGGAAAGLAALPINAGQQLVALAAAVIFPALGLLLVRLPADPLAPAGENEPPYPPPRPFPILGTYLAIATVTLAGALLVAGLLSELPYLVKNRSFAGVKLATVLPLLVVGAAYLLGLTGTTPSFAGAGRTAVSRARYLADEPLRIGAALLGLVALGVLALLLARTGNDAGVGVAGIELRLRAVLDRLLGVRPRTKEFLVGHPALLLGLLLCGLPRWRRWALAALLVGMIGQVGMLNSFCHLHTPLRITLLRTFHGFWAGALVGAVACALLLWLLRRLPPPEVAATPENSAP